MHPDMSGHAVGGLSVRPVFTKTAGRLAARNVQASGRKGFAPGVRPQYAKEVVKQGHLLSPAKKPRLEMYQEERRPPSKPVYKPVESKPFNAAVIEKKPVLSASFTATKDEWQALPQRELPQKRKAFAQDQVPKKPNIETAAKPLEKTELKKPPVKNVAKEVISAVKDTQVVKQVTPTVKNVATAVKKVTPVVKEVMPVVKEVTPAVKEAAPAVKKVTPVVEEVTPTVKNVAAVVKKVTPVVKVVMPAVKEVTPAVKEAAPAVKESATDKESTKAPERKPTAKPNSLGQYELDAVTSRVLNDELQQIMIKVWQELPDAPPTDAERLVANKFRNEAGDDLQNALGLSVTTRLLNVHNPLYVKLLFSGKPEPGCLQAFIRKFNIAAFKRIADPRRDLFAAKFDDIDDYDRLVAYAEVKCGSAKVTITPCYKYLSCPPSVKTIYADTDKTKEAAKRASTNYSPQKQANSNKTENRAQITDVKTKDDKVIEKKVNTETAKTEIKTQPAKTANSVTNIETKQSEAKTQANKTVTPVTTAKTDTNTVKVEVTALVKAKQGKVDATKEVPTEPKKITPKKVEMDNETEISDKSNKNNNDGVDDMTVVDEMGEGDDEEMTDQDILALMSGGIVLDECSGSDDEK